MTKKLYLIIPYVIIPFISPIYNILDQKIFIEVFGCGCVPMLQTNMLNIGFNANDLRRTVFWLITIIMTVLSIRISKSFRYKALRMIYCVSVFAINAYMTIYFCRNYMWQ